MASLYCLILLPAQGVKNMFTDMGRLLMWLGGAIFVIGLVFTFAGRLPWLGHLPGDVSIERANFRFFAPFGTMIILIDKIYKSHTIGVCTDNGKN
jgi:hypothetical protein